MLITKPTDTYAAASEYFASFSAAAAEETLETPAATKLDAGDDA